MSLNAWDRDFIKDNLCGVKREIRMLFEKQAERKNREDAKVIDIIEKHMNSSNGGFIKEDDDTAITVKKTGADIYHIYRMDFDLQLATVISVNKNKISYTETKKIIDMPRKMIKSAMSALSVKENPKDKKSVEHYNDIVQATDNKNFSEVSKKYHVSNTKTAHKKRSF